MGISADVSEPRVLIEACRDLMGESFVLHEAMLAGRTYGLLVQAHGVEVAALQTRKLGADQRRPVGRNCQENEVPRCRASPGVPSAVTR